MPLASVGTKNAHKALGLGETGVAIEKVPSKLVG